MEEEQLELDVGDHPQVNKRKRKSILEAEKCQEELRQMLQSEGARYFMWRLLTYCRVFQTISAVDIHNMAVLSGRRDAGLWILDEIFKADDKAFQLMQLESKDREK